MKLRILLTVCFLSIFFLFPRSALACACCTESGQYRLSDRELNELEFDLLQKVKFLSADLFASPEVVGIFFDKDEESEGMYDDFVINGLFARKNWDFKLKNPRGEVGALNLSIPATMTDFAVDTHDESIKVTPFTGPVLYKEWRFKGKVKSGTGFFQKGIDSETDYSLVLQGRGHSCTNPEDFTHWRLEVTGANAEYAFWGRLESSMPAYRVTGVQKKDVLNIRPNPRDADKLDLKGIRGKIPADGTGIFVIGKAIQFNRAYWVPIVWKGIRGWVNKKYIVQEQAKQ